MIVPPSFDWACALPCLTPPSCQATVLFLEVLGIVALPALSLLMYVAYIPATRARYQKSNDKLLSFVAANRSRTIYDLKPTDALFFLYTLYSIPRQHSKHKRNIRERPLS